VVGLEIGDKDWLVVVVQVEIVDLRCLFIKIVQYQHTVMNLHSDIVTNREIDLLFVRMDFGRIKTEH
jgi:hypothetical protein